MVTGFDLNNAKVLEQCDQSCRGHQGDKDCQRFVYHAVGSSGFTKLNKTCLILAKCSKSEIARAESRLLGLNVAVSNFGNSPKLIVIQKDKITSGPVPLAVAMSLLLPALIEGDR